MHTTFKSNLRSKSSEQLPNMVANKSSWSEDQFRLILNEAENRGLLSFVDVGYENELPPNDSQIEDKSEFERDMEIISQAETKEAFKEKHHTLGLVSGLTITLFFAFTLFGGFDLMNVENRILDGYLFIFTNYIFLIIIWFFLIWGLFIGKQYLVSSITNAALVLFLVLMSLINY